MLLGLVYGTLLGCGVWLVARGLRPVPPALADVVRDLHRPAGRAIDPALNGHIRRLALTLTHAVGAERLDRDRDLAVTGRSLERHALDKLTMAVLGAGLPVLFGVVIALGGVTVPTGLLAVASLIGGTGGFFQPDVALRAQAARQRRDFVHALSAFLDLVTVILAGGGGLEAALDGAANSGDGWAFTRIRHALAESRLSRESPWSVLARLADQLGVVELAELAASVDLAGNEGAKVRRSLAAKAASLRDHELATAHADAEAATEHMAFPVVAMLTGFILLIGYPAVANVLAL
jgi:Flp pilus assembly protein TadB